MREGNAFTLVCSLGKSQREECALARYGILSSQKIKYIHRSRPWMRPRKEADRTCGQVNGTSLPARPPSHPSVQTSKSGIRPIMSRTTRKRQPGVSEALMALLHKIHTRCSTTRCSAPPHIEEKKKASRNPAEPVKAKAVARPEVRELHQAPAKHLSKSRAPDRHRSSHSSCPPAVPSSKRKKKTNARRQMIPRCSVRGVLCCCSAAQMLSKSLMRSKDTLQGVLDARKKKC